MSYCVDIVIQVLRVVQSKQLFRLTMDTTGAFAKASPSCAAIRSPSSCQPLAQAHHYYRSNVLGARKILCCVDGSRLFTYTHTHKHTRTYRHANGTKRTQTIIASLLSLNPPPHLFSFQPPLSLLLSPPLRSYPLPTSHLDTYHNAHQPLAPPSLRPRPSAPRPHSCRRASRLHTLPLRPCVQVFLPLRRRRRPHPVLPPLTPTPRSRA